MEILKKYECYENAYIENIPLVAKVEIDKFITTVTHADKTTKTFNNATARKSLTEETKNSFRIYLKLFFVRNAWLNEIFVI